MNKNNESKNKNISYDKYKDNSKKNNENRNNGKNNELVDQLEYFDQSDGFEVDVLIRDEKHG